MAAMMISPFSTATPDNVMNPIPALIDSGMSRRNSAAIPREGERHAAENEGRIDRGAEAHEQQKKVQQ
jgi:hypothetical protein